MKRKRIYYVPGLISLIGLSILLLFMRPEKRVYQTALSFNLPTDKKDEPGLLRFSKEGFFRSIKGKKIVAVDVNDHLWNERSEYALERKFHFITQEVERIQFTHDTSVVLKVHLGENNTYGEFVRLIVRAQLYLFHRYALIDDDFYYLPDPSRDPQ